MHVKKARNWFGVERGIRQEFLQQPTVMNRNSINRLHPSRLWMQSRVAVALIVCACGLLTSRAAFLNPAAVVYVSTGADSGPAMIDDTSLSAPPSPSSTHDGVLRWTGPGSIRQEIVLDLGQAYSLTKIYLWNAQGDTTIGLKDVEIQTSPDTEYTNAQFTAVATVSLKEGGAEAQTFDIVATDARL